MLFKMVFKQVKIRVLKKIADLTGKRLIPRLE